MLTTYIKSRKTVIKTAKGNIKQLTIATTFGCQCFDDDCNCAERYFKEHPEHEKPDYTIFYVYPKPFKALKQNKFNHLDDAVKALRSL